MALELAPYKINVNAVCPAAMGTDLMEKVYRERSRFFGVTQEELRKKIRDAVPLPNELKVEDVASLVVFLVSDGARMMTGQAVNVTGGLEVH
jgi:NAD(P)-dependent dehydrogenase (short-subunit alcohol dehydrogenase family)